VTDEDVVAVDAENAEVDLVDFAVAVVVGGAVAGGEEDDFVARMAAIVLLIVADEIAGEKGRAEPGRRGWWFGRWCCRSSGCWGRCPCWAASRW
jgi:hypothetical protein